MTEELKLPSFSEVKKAMKTTELKWHPSQIHGLVCGLLCGDGKIDQAWQDIITTNKRPAKLQETLDKLYLFTAKLLQDFVFELKLILPSDNTTLMTRAESLTLFCQGFLTGLKIKNIEIERLEPGEANEAITDFIEIAKMNYENIVPTSEDEAAYTELVEYIRMAVILIYQEFNGTDQANVLLKASKRIH